MGVGDNATDIVGASPFDFTRQALLVVPEDLPTPNEPAFADTAAAAVERVIQLCLGRTLGLFTSYRNMSTVYERIKQNGYTVMRQGDLPRSELLRRFKTDVSSVLLGVDSLWTGVDVPGEALSAVVIDRLPFPPPNEPWSEAIAERDPQAFANHSLPHAIMNFAKA